MNKKIDCNSFSDLEKAVKNCRFETEEEKDAAFKSLLEYLISKNVFQSRGEVMRWRDNCLDYLTQICPCLESDELELMTKSVEEFYQRFVFSPRGKWKSLFSELQEIGVNETFNGISVSEIYEEYREKTGYSPYEKVSYEEIFSFLAGVEESMYAMA